MKPVQFLKTLKKTVPDRRTRRQLQQLLGFCLITPHQTDLRVAKQNRGSLS